MDSEFLLLEIIHLSFSTFLDSFHLLWEHRSRENIVLMSRTAFNCNWGPTNYYSLSEFLVSQTVV